jgi:GMP synthase (glutamine-hydrolysing)
MSAKMPKPLKGEAIVVLDFGGQYAHLIARRIRGLDVYAEVLPGDADPMDIGPEAVVKGIILSGGPQSVYAEGAPKVDPELLGGKVPILGICYGHQLIAQLSGGKVLRSQTQEYGITEVRVLKSEGVLRGLGPQERVWMSHGDAVVDIAPDYEVLAETRDCPVAAMRHKTRPIYGIQWHPEVSHTERGVQMLRNFALDICGCAQTWTSESFMEGAIEEMKGAIGEGKAIIALSGGVDSSTATILATKAIGKDLTAVFVDHGFMREGEPELISRTFQRMGVNLISVNARRRFLDRLANVTDPERKRKIIGEEFIRVFEEEAVKIGAEYLIQGTIYPDRIESGFRRHSEKIKTHHNVAGLPTKVEFKAIIEPLRELYKDEVRKVAKELGLPGEMVMRQPFPGPGLAVRIVGEVTEEKLEVVRGADAIVREELEKLHDEKLWEFFAVLTNTLSTGVKGDMRAYGYTVAIRAVESLDGMTANFARIPYDVLEEMATRIVNELPKVTRVVYDITHKPPATIEWE